MFLIDDILLAPVKGLVWIGKQISEMAEKELYDEERIKELLMELQLKFELYDEISEEEYKKQEKKLLARLDAIRKIKEEV